MTPQSNEINSYCDLTHQGKNSYFVISGEIGFSTPFELQNKLANSEELKFIYADTSGGFSGSAMDIAELMTKHDLSLIIDGIFTRTYLCPKSIASAFIDGIAVFPNTQCVCHYKTVTEFR